MATLICDMSCKHRSKQPLRNWKKNNGEKLYGCKLRYVCITRISDPDDYVVEVVGESEMAHCPMYDPVEDDGEQDGEE